MVEQVFDYVSKVVRSTEIYMYEGLYDAQNLAIICNAMARIDYDDQELLLHLSLIIQQVLCLFIVQQVLCLFGRYVCTYIVYKYMYMYMYVHILCINICICIYMYIYCV